ncbi:MAG: hypothetical protein LBL59_09065 [Xanthomonadaceae bacterium]|jgi:hypothetical protein|nr:hypothetical protein [Xanthomonadaceae bacterium]
MNIKLLPFALSILLLGGCGNPSSGTSSPAESEPPAPISGTAGDASTAPDATRAAHDAPAVPKHTALSKACGDIEAYLQCVTDQPETALSVNCEKTRLLVRARDGNTIEAVHPEEMKDFTALGLACATQSGEPSPYVVVQYGELPAGCSFCEWFYLYDANGEALNRNDRIVLNDPGHPQASQVPNNTVFEEELEKRNLAFKETDNIICDSGPMGTDEAGNPICTKEF